MKKLKKIISDNIATLVQTNKFGTIHTTDRSTIGYYVIKLMLEPYTLQEEITCHGQIFTSGELVFK